MLPNILVAAVALVVVNGVKTLFTIQRNISDCVKTLDNDCFKGSPFSDGPLLLTIASLFTPPTNKGKHSATVHVERTVIKLLEPLMFTACFNGDTKPSNTLVLALTWERIIKVTKSMTSTNPNTEEEEEVEEEEEEEEATEGEEADDLLRTTGAEEMWCSSNTRKASKQESWSERTTRPWDLPKGMSSTIWV